MITKDTFNKVTKTIAVYGVQIWVILFIANIAVITLIRYKAQAQSCMTQSQINSDNRCLYILDGNIYSQGSRSRPHKGHPCGMDVTNIIPSFHTNNVGRYLLPNFVGPVCSGNAPTSTPTQQPTNPPTQTPTRTPTQQPTNPPTQTPTRTPTANSTITNTPSPTPTKTPTTSPNTASNKTAAPTSAPATQPTEIPDNSGFLRLMSYISGKQTVPSPTKIDTDKNIPSNTVAPSISVDRKEKDQLTHMLIYWSTIISYVSFLLLLFTAGYWLVQKIKLRIKS